ncbi:DUF411 domain-containing protein [Sphingobium sp. 10 DY56-G10]|uniref:DUF411 domain-containing protein n=1 Tax=Sphingomonadales TaxID=204457 RepID=UPI0000D7BF22|nr:DUF411 domain-containing protein [Sphingomonas sp. SKA58]EAT09464.1 hypothetical protein SKA58_04090 [Sphingomonas sp. SKA58]MAM83580.1 metal-binding protein [Acidobacteriota bacterium]
MLKNLMMLAVGPALLLVPGMGTAAERPAGVMYKNPGCECCDGHAEALRRAGLDLRVVASDNLADLKTRAGVPARLQGCHTILIGGHAVEGHVPVAAIQRLLAQKRAVRGIALPGMPAGSPGMGGAKAAPFKVMSFGAQGTQIFAVE